MSDLFDMDHDGETDFFEQATEYDFLEYMERENNCGSSFNRGTGKYSSSRGKSSWGVFFLAIFFGFLLPPVGLYLMGIAIIMAILE